MVKPKDVIVTYGEDNSVGKEMLRRALTNRITRLMGCACCRIICEPHESGECEQCRCEEGWVHWIDA